MKNFGLFLVVGALIESTALADSGSPTEKYVGTDSQGNPCTAEVYRSGGQVQDISLPWGHASYDPDTTAFFTCEFVRNSTGSQIVIRTWEGEDMEMWFQEASLKYTDDSQTKLVEASYRIGRRAMKLLPSQACASLLATPQDTCTITGPAQ